MIKIPGANKEIKRKEDIITQCGVLWFVLFAQYRRKYKWAKHETR
jgi:hypothetical protein